MARKLIVDVIGDSSSYTSAIDKATGKTTGFKSVLTGAAMGVGLGMWNAAAAGIGSIVSVLGDADQAYKEDVASQAKLKTALGNSVKAWDGNTTAIEKVISAQMDLGFADDAQRDSLALLVGATNDIAQAQALQVAAMDLARLKGIDLASATDIMIKANEGNYRGLKSVGITLDSNTTATEALAAVTALAGGQAEAYAAGPLGRQEAAQLKVSESMERIGSVVNQVSSTVLPILADVLVGIVDVFMDVWGAIQPVIAAIDKEFGPAIRAVIGFIQQTVFPILRTLIGTYFEVLGKVIGWIANTVIPPFRAVFSFLAQNVFPLVSKGIDRLSSGMKTLGGIFSTVAGAISRAWNTILGVIRRVINTIIRGWNSLRFEVPSVDLGPLGKVGGFSIGTPNIPLLHSGGMVPGRKGQDVLAILQAGEHVTPVNGSPPGGPTIIIEQFYGSDRDIEKFSDRLAARLRYAPR